MRRLKIATTCAGLLWAAIGAGAAEARLDQGFGQGGIVQVQPSKDFPGPSPTIAAMAAARDGSSYAVFASSECNEQAACSVSSEISRYRPDGTLDTSFGSGGSTTLPVEEGSLALAVDSAGRAVIAKRSPTAVVVRRLNMNGSLDARFGTQGAVWLTCTCGFNPVQLVPGVRGTMTVVFPHISAGRLIRLSADGSMVRSFGKDGVVAFPTRGSVEFSAVGTGKGGAMYLAGSTCCSSSYTPFLVRVSAHGTVDSRFTKATVRTLRRIGGPHAADLGVNAVVVRPHGTIDLLGADGSGKGFLVRLGADGRAVRAFGDKGRGMLTLPVTSGALGSDGAVIALSADQSWGGTVFRIFRDGQIDRSFGFENIPGTEGDLGMSIVGQTGRRALVLDLGLHECPRACAATPKLIRYVEGQRRRGR